MEQEKLKTEYIFPNYYVRITCLDKTKIINYLTYIRKKHRRTWYLIPIRMNCEILYGIDDDLVMLQENKRFILQSYLTLLFYIIDPEMAIRKPYGPQVMIYVDIDQNDEKTRLGIGL